MSQKTKFGISPAMVTPLDASYGVDMPALSMHAADLLSRGCPSVTLFGTTGEGCSFGYEARQKAADQLLASGLASSQLIEGIIVCSQEEATASVAAAMKRGSRAVLLAPPFYFRPVAEEAVYLWFKQVLTGAGSGLRDVILYHIPQMTGVPLSMDLIARLRKDFPGAIVGVKDSSGNKANTDDLLKTHGDLHILVGDERYLGEACAKGASGAICGVSNMLPELLVSVVEKGQNHDGLTALVDAILQRPVTPAVKALTAHLRKNPSFARPRPPLLPIDAENTAAMVKLLTPLLP